MGKELLDTIRFCIIFMAVVIAVTMCCGKAQAFEKTYKIPVAALKGETENETMLKCLLAEVSTLLDFMQSHYHCGDDEILYKAERVGDNLFIFYKCSCEEVSCESNSMHKMSQGHRLPSLFSG